MHHLSNQRWHKQKNILQAHGTTAGGCESVPVKCLLLGLTHDENFELSVYH